MCSNETGSCGGFYDEGGTNFATPCLVRLRICPPCQGAPLMECHISRSESHEDTVCLETDPAPRLAMKRHSKASLAGIRKFLCMLYLSQNCVKRSNPAP
jgi:hypothetical protein